MKLFFGWLFIALSLITLEGTAQSSNPPFWNEIRQFKKADSASMPPKNAILFVGSSSFTKWKNVQDFFPGYSIINRGFGGSQLTDVFRYTYDIILPYAPRQVIIYCGENDLSSFPRVKVEDVVTRFQTLFGVIRQNLPQATIHFISMKPSPSRYGLMPAFMEANQAIKSFLEKQSNAGYIDVFDAMLDHEKNPNSQLFVGDKLHMNAAGYAIWQKIIEPYLQK